MSDYCVVVADGAHARFFTLEQAEVPSATSGPNLVEMKDLISTESVVKGRDMWTDDKSGRNTAAIGGPAHGYDDHRDQHEDEFMRRFASALAGQALHLAEQNNAKHLILVSGKRMLGFLRNEVEIPAKAGIEVSELAKDLLKFSERDIHQHLTEAGLLPPRKQPAA